MLIDAPQHASLPGPRPLPWLGSYGNKLLFYRDPIAYHRKVYQTYGILATFVQGGRKVLMYAPQHYRQVLHQPDRFQVDMILPGTADSPLGRLGAGLPAMNGEQHRRQRRLLMPAFHREQIDAHRDAMVAVTTHRLESWQPGQVRDIAGEMRAITLSIAGRTLLGLDMTAEAGTLAHLIERWIGMLASIAVRMVPVDLPGTPYRRLLDLSAVVEGQLKAMIRQRRALPPQSQDALSLLLMSYDQDGTPMTEAELISQVAMLFVAGFETSATALTWILFLLAQHPHVLADLLDELDGVLRGAPPSVEQLQALPLLEGVIKESMRLLPPAIQGGRVSTEPFELGSYQFPAGTKVMWSQYITHHMPDLYAQPERFLPERWHSIEPAPYSYLPFLAGSRTCLGAAFAMMEMKIVLAMIVQRYRLALQPGTTINRQVRFTLAPRGGLPMRIHKQDRSFERVAVRGDIHELVDLTW